MTTFVSSSGCFIFILSGLTFVPVWFIYTSHPIFVRNYDGTVFNSGKIET